jgi:cobalt-zinc-cadmium efflux system membrane fusion protein
MQKNLIVGGTAALIATTALIACRGHMQAPAPEGPKSRVSGETVALAAESAALLQTTAVIQAPGEHPTLPGRLAWDEDHTVRVLTPFAGRVGEILVKVGETVQQGQPLATLLSPDFGAAQAEARKAQAALGLSQRSLARVKDLAEHGVAAAKEVDQAEADFAGAKAEVERTTARLRLAGEGREAIDQRFSLKSPISGVVVERNINPGQELRPDQPGLPLFVVTNPASLWVSLDATESDAIPTRAGAAMQLRTQELPGQTFPATLIQVADFVDPVTRTIKLRGQVDNHDRRLKGEMFVTAELQGAPSNALAAPASTVFLLGSDHYVFVAIGKDSFTRRKVDVDFSNDGLALFKANVTAGENLVSDGALFLERIIEQSEADTAASSTSKPAA